MLRFQINLSCKYFSSKISIFQKRFLFSNDFLSELFVGIMSLRNLNVSVYVIFPNVVSINCLLGWEFVSASVLEKGDLQISFLSNDFKSSIWEVVCFSEFAIKAKSSGKARQFILIFFYPCPNSKSSFVNCQKCFQYFI